MDLIKRYVREVGRHLPRKNRKDIENELQSSLEDTMESRAGTSGRAPDEQLEAEILKEYGPPAQMAASYRTGVRHLVGPEWYPGFITTIQICLIVLAGLYLLGLVTGLASTSRSLSEAGLHLLATWSDFQSGALAVFGLVVLIFAIIERVSDGRRELSNDWDPRSLPPLDDPNRLSRSEPIVGMTLTALFLFLLFFFPGRIGSFVSVGADSCWVPMLGPGFDRHLPLLFLFLGSAFVLSLVQFHLGRWTRATRWADFAVNLLPVAILYRLAFGASILAADPQTAILQGCSPESATAYHEVATTVLPGLLKVGFTLGMLGAAVASLFKLSRAVRSGG